MHPTLEKLYEQYGDQITIKSIDLAIARDFAKNYPIRVTPTLFFFKADGTPFVPSEELVKELNYVSYKRKSDDTIAVSGNEGVVKYEILVKLLKEMGVNVR